MIRLIAVARIRNEDDIIEAFVRHHAALVDRLILLDNASNDRTPEILRALKDEGLPLTVYRCESVTFIESTHNTFLLRQAAALGADWVLCLDVDEFVEAQHVDGCLRECLASVQSQVDCLDVELVNYQPTNADNAAELVVPRRMTRRSVQNSDTFKVFARGRLAAQGAVVAHGNHDMLHEGRRIARTCDPLLTLAHYPMRSGWQMLTKAFVGRLKLLASGREEVERQTALHYTQLLANLEEHPEWLLFDQEYLNGTRPPQYVAGGAVMAPLAYLGGDLRYTEARDPRVHAARSLVAAAEALARRHGALIDQFGAARDVTAQLDTRISQVF
jgi:hypothetical protein